MPEVSDQWKGTAVPDPSVAGYIRKHGTPAHSAPDGNGNTILYYNNPDYKGTPTGEKFEDFAGKETPGGSRTMVVQKNGPGAFVESSVTARQVGAPGGGGTKTATPIPQSHGGNPNDLVRDSSVKGGDVSSLSEVEPTEGGQNKVLIEVSSNDGTVRVLDGDEASPATTSGDDASKTESKKEPVLPAKSEKPSATSTSSESSTGPSGSAGETSTPKGGNS